MQLKIKTLVGIEGDVDQYGLAFLSKVRASTPSLLNSSVPSKMQDREAEAAKSAIPRPNDGGWMLSFHVNTHFLFSSLFPGDVVPTRFRCPCCGYRTLETAGALALCPVCWWEDDGQEDADASDVRLTVNGDLSLNEARAFYVRCGAAHPRFLPYVRKPLASDL
jgi:hypothetical protein